MKSVGHFLLRTGRDGTGTCPVLRNMTSRDGYISHRQTYDVRGKGDRPVATNTTGVGKGISVLFREVFSPLAKLCHACATSCIDSQCTLILITRLPAQTKKIPADAQATVRIRNVKNKRYVHRATAHAYGGCTHGSVATRKGVLLLWLSCSFWWKIRDTRLGLETWISPLSAGDLEHIGLWAYSQAVATGFPKMLLFNSRPERDVQKRASFCLSPQFGLTVLHTGFPGFP